MVHQRRVITSCGRAAATICLRPLQVDNIFVFIRQVAPVPACWLFGTSATMKVVSESHVMWATSVRQTDKTSDRRQTKASLNASALWRRRHNNECDVLFHNICTSEMIVTDNYNLCSVRSIFIIQPSMF